MADLVSQGYDGRPCQGDRDKMADLVRVTGIRWQTLSG